MKLSQILVFLLVSLLFSGCSSAAEQSESPASQGKIIVNSIQVTVVSDTRISNRMGKSFHNEGYCVVNEGGLFTLVDTNFEGPYGQIGYLVAYQGKGTNINWRDCPDTNLFVEIPFYNRAITPEK